MAALTANSISNPGQNLSAGDRDELFMRTSVMMDKQIVRTIPHG